jgi:hypothetical protein
LSRHATGPLRAAFFEPRIGRENVARFVVNRRWTLILALGVSLFLGSLAHRPVVAGDYPGTGIVGAPAEPPGGQDGSGDPDVPIGPCKGAKAGKLSRGGTDLGPRAAGDGRVARSVLVWRLRVVLQGLRGFYLRF